MKKLVSLSVLALLAPTCLYGFITRKESTVLLESPIFYFIDGNPYGINADGISDLLYIIREIMQVRLGKVTQGSRVGMFVYEGTSYSLETLAQLEQELIRQGTYEQHKVALNALLEELKATFERIVAPFMENARGAKSQMLVLIEESCKKRNLANTFLLAWGAEKEGEDLILFRQEMNSFTKLDRFCTDLVNFLEDLMHSCKKGMAQFIHQAKKKAVIKHMANITKNMHNGSKLQEQFIAHLDKDQMESLTWKEVNSPDYIKQRFNDFKAKTA